MYSSSTQDHTSVSNTFGGTGFGGFNINTGIKTEWVIGGLVIVAALWFFKGKK